jgi:two-component system phosphate regulon sensor histidine kinase PhoR
VSLRVDALSDEARAVLESVREDVDGLSRTVDDLLTLATVDQGRLTLVRESIDLNELVQAATQALAPLAQRSGVRLQADGERVVVVGDVERLRQALGNLLDNAIKFSPPGAAVHVSTCSVDHIARVTVADEGPGIRRDDRERIFERFVRGDAARSRGAGGSGLGLSIVREIVTAHGGAVTVDTRQPHGSVFAIELPIADVIAHSSVAGPELPVDDRHPALHHSA